eukprot:scaffold22043_cov84-Isochrysis_galbana.AAC.1
MKRSNASATHSPSTRHMRGGPACPLAPPPPAVSGSVDALYRAPRRAGGGRASWPVPAAWWGTGLPEGAAPGFAAAVAGAC